MDNVISKVANVKSYKFHVYSAHDTTVMLMLNGLQLTSSECKLKLYNNEIVDDPKRCIYTVLKN